MRIRVLGQYVQMPIAALATMEAILFFLAFYAATLARFGGLDIGAMAVVEHDHGPLWGRALLFSALTVTCLLAFGLYSARQRARVVGLFVRAAAALTAAVMLMAAVLYIMPGLWIDRGVIALAAVGAICATLLLRLIFSRIVDVNMFKRRVLVYGAGGRATAISKLRRRSDRRGFLVVGYVKPPDEESVLAAEEIFTWSAESRLAAMCKSHDVHEIVMAMDDRRRGFPIGELLECRLAGVEVTELATFLERETGRVRLDVLNPSWMIFADGFKRGPLRLFSSRAVDLVASLLILLVSLPVIVLTTVSIKLEDGWRAPIFYRQQRVGLGGRIFNVLKFRSMRTDAERNGPQWAQRKDPRVTRVGSFIRKLRVDELPQIFNVVRGHMSFVGPRPERPQFVSELAARIPFYEQRHSVKPGITGWAQLCYPYGSSEQDALEKLQYDLYYIKNNSLLFDLAILVQTAEVVFLGKGAL